MKQQYILFLLFVASTCVFALDFSSDVYQKLGRQQKLQSLWSEVTKNTESAKFPGPLETLKVFAESMEVTMTYKSDVLPQGRQKLIHAVGSVATASYIPDEPNGHYTGFFQGADSLILRFSLAKSPDYSKTKAVNAKDNYVPGLGLKYLIDGEPSANLVAMLGVNGVDNFNFFASDFSTHIAAAQGLVLNLVAAKFSSGSDIVQNVGLRNFAETFQNGQSTPQLSKYPFKLVFRAPESIKKQFSEDFKEIYSDTLSRIQKGTIILEVFAMNEPKEGCLVKIGVIKTTSTFTTSKFGDESLFFQHQDYNRDLVDNPWWNDYTPFWKNFGSKNAKKQEGKCPFA